MTSTVTEVTTTFIVSTPYDTLSTTVGIITVVLLLVLLMVKELIRAYGGPLSQARMQALNIAIIPLLFAFAVITAMRFVEILP